MSGITSAVNCSNLTNSPTNFLKKSVESVLMHINPIKSPLGQLALITLLGRIVEKAVSPAGEAALKKILTEVSSAPLLRRALLVGILFELLTIMPGAIDSVSKKLDQLLLIEFDPYEPEEKLLGQ